MNKFFKKHVPVTIGALMATSPLFVSADMDARLNKLESQMKDCGTQTARGNFGARTASADANLDGYGFYLTADAILWHMMTDDADYAMTNTGTTGVEGTVKHNDFEWSWGFKTGIGYMAEHDNWDTGFNFTWFRTHSNDSLAGVAGTVQPLHGNQETLDVGTNDYTSIGSNWKFHYYDLGWQVGRNFFVSKYLALRPNVGVRANWMYNQRTDTSTITATNYFVTTNNCDFESVGPSAGLDATMYFGRHFNLYASTGGALLWGRFTPNAQTVDESDVVSNDVKGNFHRVVPNLNLALGLGYNTNFMDDNFNFGIRLGYESQYFFRAMQTFQFLEGAAGATTDVMSRTNGDLMLHGFNLNVSFAF